MVQAGPQIEAIAVMCPHAGLMYSGSVAGAVYSAVRIPETVLLLGPNHTGLGANISMMMQGEWEIPTGLFTIDEALARAIQHECPDAQNDVIAHVYEHSLEVQLPFIAHFALGARIVPIAIKDDDPEGLAALGEGIARAIKSSGRQVLIVASSDMSHFLPDAAARRKDRIAIDRVLALDPQGLYRVVRDNDISMCGVLPAFVMLTAAKALGARQAELVKYATSGEVSGEMDRVVGYAGIIVRK